MGTKTSGDLKLEKPNNGEYIDGWDSPINDNSDRIEAGASYAIESVQNAAGNFTDDTPLDVPAGIVGTANALQKRLDTFSDSSGNPIPPAELLFTRDDRMIGTQQGLFDVIAKLERYMFWLAQGNEDSGANIPDRLRNELARRGLHTRNSILGNATVSIATHGGSPNIPVIGMSGGNPFDVDIDGKIYKVRKDLFAAGTLDTFSRGVAMLYLEPADESPSDAGSQLVYSGSDGKFEQVPASTGPWRKFTSASNPSLVNAKAGDVLRIENKSVGGYDIAGDYIIESTPTGGEITIIGGLPAKVDGSVTVIENCTFKVLDLWACKLGYEFFSSAAGEFSDINMQISDPSNKAFVGEIWWSGTAVVDTPFAYAPFGIYDSNWQSAPAGPPLLVPHVGAGAPIAHNVGIDVKPWQEASKESIYPTIKIFSARKDASGNIFDIQEQTFDPHFGGGASFSNGWLGYCNRRYYEFQYGVELYGDVDLTYKWGYQRKVDMGSFPNNPLTDASFEYTQSNCVYRVIVTR